MSNLFKEAAGFVVNVAILPADAVRDFMTRGGALVPGSFAEKRQSRAGKRIIKAAGNIKSIQAGISGMFGSKDKGGKDGK